MNKVTLHSTLAILSLLAFSPEARADDADKAACADLENGDDCVRGDGDEGTCVPDDSDPGVLTCEDEAFDSMGDSGDDGSDGGNEAACVDLELGEICLRNDGQEGTCVPDDSDPNVLECEDDSVGSGADDGASGGGSNNAACAFLEEGDACERDDGDPGTCVPDDSDPDMLECEDEAASSSESDNDITVSCSVGDGTAPLGTMSVLVLFGLGAVRRRMLA